MDTALAGAPYNATLTGAEPGVTDLGLHLAVPVTWAICAARVPTTETAPGTYQATIIAPRQLGELLVVWSTPEDPPVRLYVTTVEVVATPGVLPGAGELGLPPAPELEDVAALIWARTVDQDGNDAGGTFTADTRPSEEQVLMIMESVRREVATRLRTIIPDGLVEAARDVVAIGTVSYIEQSFFPETTQAGESAFASSRAIFLARLNDLNNACTATTPLRIV